MVEDTKGVSCETWYLGNSGNFWELTEILDPFNLGISENVWELFEISDTFYIGILGNFWELLGI